jgi:polyhydroxyalkanoate synthesis regulator phasin
VQEEYLRNSIYAYFEYVKKQIKEKAASMIDEEGKISDDATRHIVSEVIKEQYGEWEKTDNIPSIPKSFNTNIIDKYGRFIDEAIKETFEELPLSKSHSKRLMRIAGSLFSKFPEGIEKEGLSGVVIAGFGEKDAFPSLKSFHTEGIVNNKLKYEEYTSGKIDFETSASIIAFAQREMVATFMEGIDPFYRDVEESYLSQVFDRYAEIIVDSIKGPNNKEKSRLKEKLARVGGKILEDLKKKLEDHRNERYVNPVTSVVSMLPKDELAVMAETLVNLTSFKRKVTMESETVGGPIDVAVISKGDGFIWIKRKHYFRAELNPQFFANYYRGGMK